MAFGSEFHIEPALPGRALMVSSRSSSSGLPRRTQRLSLRRASWMARCPRGASSLKLRKWRALPHLGRPPVLALAHADPFRVIAAVTERAAAPVPTHLLPPA